MDELHNLKLDRRRRRPALSCVSCRRSKIRCDRNLPCGACVRSKHKTCVYEPQGLSRHSDILPGAVGPSQPTDTLPALNSETTVSPVAGGSAHAHRSDGSHHDHSAHSMTGSTPVDSTSSQGNESSFDVRALLDRISDLERRLEESMEYHSSPKNSKPHSATVPETVATYPSYLAGELHTMNKSVMTKTRYLGQSHWMNQIGGFKPILELFDRLCREKKSEAIALVNKSKTLARTIKAQRVPDLLKFKFGTNVPCREVADKLVDGYLRTVESVYRILHVPSFRKEYEVFWSSPDSVDLSFVIQLQLVMAIGCTVYDEQFSLRKSAIQWVYEAQFWLMSPIPKTRLTLSGLQVMLLLCFAQQAASVGHDLVWIPVGDVMRTAMYMGLHRDPKKLPRMNTIRSEMRRRLWNTILELALQTSMDSGGPPLIHFQDYDTCAPTNINDDQLTDDNAPAIASPLEQFTDTSAALALRITFPARLEVARSLNEFDSQHTYEDALRLHGQLSTAYKSLSQYLQKLASSDRQPTAFQRRFIDILVRRYFMALHLPYFNPSMVEPAYAFSRKTVIEMSVKMWLTVFPAAALNPRPFPCPPNGPETISTNADDLARMTTCAGGVFRCILSQVSMSIGLELKSQLQEDDGLGPPTPRIDLFNILRDSASWIFGRVKIGETNIKGYMFTAALVAQVEALMSGLKGPDLTDVVIKAGTEAIRESFNVLKQRAEMEVDEAANTNDSEAQFNFDTMMAMEEDWEYDNSMQNVLFDFTSIESVLGVASGTDMTAAPDFSQWS
ncbi:uncharacterized protein GGS22DRAFT_193133 [Annulohypoxylon maeteangense]|uniref:uncharacterized protein n=1 Tax=Annulohypoxylon maeteangense TaxID=1927788 RepID=UPI0020087A0B|nr:uncharacterized protein GGS22DRAFT_193133 [Annulohypoxylon maeteangense]KAI0880554.1 hypothetical protein GGS22DRAFT_193133 [Annulohypoxylon maeteangense]